MKTNILLCGFLAAMLAAPFAGYAAAQGSPAGEKPKRTADEQWNPPRGAHVGGNNFSTFCIHDGENATFVIAYHGDFDSTSRSSSNAKARTWNNDVTLTAKKPNIALSFHRTHTAPGKLSITTAPAEGRDLAKPAPPPRDFGQKEHDLANGRVFLLTDNGTVRQLDLPTPVVTDQESAKTLAALIAAIPPQERETETPMNNATGKLQSETVAKLKWGEPVNGLRMALAYPPALKDALLGDEPVFQLVVQNVSEKEVHFVANDAAPNPRKLLIREGESIVQGISDPEVSAADWKLQPGQCGVLTLYNKEAAGKGVVISSSAIESDLSKIGRYHAIVKMEVAKAPVGAWTGKLVTGQTRGSADKIDAPAPQHKDARGLYDIWQRHARANGDIPGALVGELAAAVKVLIGYNPTWENVPKLNEILPRLDATRDWKAADVVALLDEMGAIKDAPFNMASWIHRPLRKGEKLPEKFADAEWSGGKTGDLRVAWVLEPGGAEHRIGIALKARLLVWNTGAVPVMLQVPTWHQGGVTAIDAKGAEAQVSGIEWTTLPASQPVRLGPSEYIEIRTPGVGLGEGAGRGPWAGPRVGSNVFTKPGDELTLTHTPVPLDGSEEGIRDGVPPVVGAGWWLAHIKTRLSRELPLPADSAERTHLLDRAVRELFATAPTAEEIAAFTADQTPGALDALAKRLAERPDVVEFAGKLPPAPVKFRVLAADAAADKTPRVVLGPGVYPLGNSATLKMVGRPDGERYIYDTKILFEATEATGKLAPEPHKVVIPGDRSTWAIVCRPGEGFFYVLHQGAARRIDYTSPRKVTDTPATDLPADFRAEVKRQLDLHEVSAESQAEVFEKPAPPAATPAPATSAAKPGAKLDAVPVVEKAAGTAIRGQVLRTDGTPAAGVQVRVDDGIERWKFRGPEIPELPKAVTTAADGTISIEVPKGSTATNFEVFASSDEFAPLNAKVPAGGDVGVMQLAKGSRVTGRVFGLDGAGLAKVGLWCKRLDWKGRGPAPAKLASTGADGSFSIPSLATGDYLLVILTRDLGPKELAVAFANPVIEVKGDASVAVEIRPLPTVDLTLDARVQRSRVEFSDFELRVSGTLPGHQAGEPVSYWTRQETTKLGEGRHTIAVPAGLQNARVRADRIYMRKGDEPVFIWRREGEEEQTVNNTLELGVVDKPWRLGITVQDAAVPPPFIVHPR